MAVRDKLVGLTITAAVLAVALMAFVMADSAAGLSVPHPSLGFVRPPTHTGAKQGVTTLAGRGLRGNRVVIGSTAPITVPAPLPTAIGVIISSLGPVTKSVLQSSSASTLSPPRYGAYFSYFNNSSYSSTFLQTLREQLISLLNDDRVANGLPALTESNQLDLVAAARSQDMYVRAYFDHIDPTGPKRQTGDRVFAMQELDLRNGFSPIATGELLVNIYQKSLTASTPSTIALIVQNHKGYRENALSRDYTKIGVGVSTSLDNGVERTLITCEFLD